MKLCVVAIGETHKKWAVDGENEYRKRIVKYIPLEDIVIPDIKNTRSMTTGQQKEQEGRLILNALQPSDYVVLLDEKGKDFTSRQFADSLQDYMNRVAKRLVFVIGGPYGFSPDVYSRADAMMSLSRMTFPHDLVRVLFLEQIYRALTILRGEPYHHD